MPISDDSAANKTADDRISLFILKSRPDTLKQAETFLKNRGWFVSSGIDLREALTYLASAKPQVIMLAADHPNKKVILMPRLLRQAYSVKIIGYAENQTQGSLTSLQTLESDHSLYPPVSGPAVERLVLKLRRDEEKKAKESKIDHPYRSGGDASSTGNTVMHVRGETGGTALSGEEAEKARTALAQLILSGDAETGGTFVAKGEALAPAVLVGEGQGAGESFAEWEERKRNAMLPAKAQQDGPAEAESFSEWEERKRKENAFAAPGTGENDSTKNDSSKNIENSKKSSSDITGDSGATGNFGEESYKRKQKQIPNFEFDNIQQQQKAVPSYESGSLAPPKAVTIFEQGTQEALDNSVKPAQDGMAVQKISRSSNCACIIVESARFSGYLVAALGNNRQVDPAFIEMIQQRLLNFLRARGEKIDEQDPMGIKIREVEFEDWALDQAEFLRKSVHGNEEIAMAFFPTEKTSARLEVSASEKMLKMNIDEFKEEIAVEFDLYIYMPENSKYLLYTPVGRTLFGIQMNRLQDKGVTHLHLRKESAVSVKKYRAQNYLNTKIEAYKARAKAKKP